MLQEMWRKGEDNEQGLSSRTHAYKQPLKTSNSHVSGLMSHNKGGGEAVFVVQGAAPDWVAHSCDRSVTCREKG